MPKINVYLPEELADAVRDSAIPVSAVCQHALQRAVREVTAMRESTRRLPERDGATTKLKRFTDRARTVIDIAQQRAEQLGDSGAGTAHLLLGILDEAANLAVQGLRALEVDPEDVRAELQARMQASRDAEPEAAGARSGERPGFTPTALRAIELATTEALALGHNYVGCEHLLLALAAEPDGLAGQVLRGMGVDHRSARRTVVTLLSGFVYARQGTVPPAPSPAGGPEGPAAGPAVGGAAVGGAAVGDAAGGGPAAGGPAAQAFPAEHAGIAAALEQILRRLDQIEEGLPK